jgi:hypothetical protein
MALPSSVLLANFMAHFHSATIIAPIIVTHFGCSLQTGYCLTSGAFNLFPVVGQPESGLVEFAPVSNLVVAAVPEASTWAMMLLGFAGVGFAAYRKGLIRYEH